MNFHSVVATATFAGAVACCATAASSPDKATGGSQTPAPLPVEGSLPSLAGATAWLNSRPLTPGDLRGKVVLVNFWTYTCINWLRSFPYVREWAEKYRSQGLVVIGVHAPEFSFERDTDNVQRAISIRNISYPVAVDNEHAVWRAFHNSVWPALYFVDAQGRIRHHQFGEGGYERSESVIQQLLAENGVAGASGPPVSIEPVGIEAAPDLEDLASAETYVGYDLGENFVSPGGIRPDRERVYVAPLHMETHRWALSGNWTVGREAATLNVANGRIVYRFHARDLHLVMRPAARGTGVRFRVHIDGRPPGVAHGVDVDDQGNGTVLEQRVYQLVRQSAPVVDRDFDIEFMDAGVEVFSFTFG